MHRDAVHDTPYRWLALPKAAAAAAAAAAAVDSTKHNGKRMYRVAYSGELLVPNVKQ
jgi:hypothetical protein